MPRFSTPLCKFGASAIGAVVLAAPVFSQGAPGLPEPFVYLSEVAPDIQQDMRYASGNNFVGRRVDGYLDPECILTRDTAETLQRVQQTLSGIGLSLRVYDCYRPARAVTDFMDWSQDGSETKAKQQYYPDLDKRNLFKLGYIAARSMHSRGNTVDLTIVRKGMAVAKGGEQHKPLRCDSRERPQDNSLDFGTSFDCFSPKSHTDAVDISDEARRNRRLLVDMMEKQGFKNYNKEWWHFELPRAATAVAYDFPIGRDPKQRDKASEPITSLLAHSKPDCPLAIADPSELYSVDCNGKSVNVYVLESVSGIEKVGMIEEYNTAYLSPCRCSIEVDVFKVRQEWCYIKYVRTVRQEFEGWVLFKALRNPKDGPPPMCERAASRG
jgi:zinc D-Ala-D-Ala dipeptidase